MKAPSALTIILTLVLSDVEAQTVRRDVPRIASGHPRQVLDIHSPAGAKSLRGGWQERGDVDRDNRLDEDESATLRAAFGGIDAPLLPAKPYRYAPPGSAVTTALREADNTPPGNPVTDAGATLGRVLFYDRLLSKNDTVACASCHVQEHAFSDPRRLSVGYEGGTTKRNSMGLENVRYTVLRGRSPGFFWDERAPTLEAQVLMPIQDKVEMGMELPALVEKLETVPYYPPLFKAAFGTESITSERIARAVAQFMRAMVSFDSKFDRCAERAKENGAEIDYTADFPGFTAKENLGKTLFIQGINEVAELGCAFCHIPPTFRMPASFNNGLDLVYADQGLGALNRPSNDPFTPSNDGKFKAPSLRNVELTAPYMHDGRFRTLEEVVEHYSSGVHPHPNVGLAFENRSSAPRTSGFGYTPAQKSALVAFLKTLTDRTLLTDPRFSDPFPRAPKRSDES